MTTTTPPAIEPAESTDPVDPPEIARRSLTANRIGLGVLLVGTAVFYLWNITINGMGNQFYAAAAQAGSMNWEALLFGSLDSRNFITVDKPPLSQWVMGLSGQLFGFSSASMLIPQALMAVGAVWLLYATVKRISGPRAGLLAGAALALTPVAVLMFRFNNPDASMVLLMTAAAYCTVRALEAKGAKWMALAGVALGFAFLAKMLEGVMVMPALAGAYLLAAPVSLRSRIFHVLGGAAAFLVSAGWFVVLTMLWPASSRPYIAGSTNNDFMNLVLGYNGISRVLGRKQPGFVMPPADVIQHGNGGFGGQTQGWTRLFSGEFGFEIGWLIPASLLATVLVLVARRRAPRTDLIRAGAVLFGTWIVVDGLVLSFMHGMIHPYYSLSIAPAVAAMFAIGTQQMWALRESWWGRIGLAGTLLAAGVWSWWLLARNEDWHPGLRWTILVLTALACIGLLGFGAMRARRTAVLSLAGVAVVGALAGPAAYALATVAVAHQGGGPLVGPPRTSEHANTNWGKLADNPQLEAMLRATTTPWSAAIERSSSAAGLELASNTAVMAIGGFSDTDPTPTLAEFKSDVANHRVTYYIAATNKGHGPAWGGHAHADIADWVAATFTPQKVGDETVYDLSRPK